MRFFHQHEIKMPTAPNHAARLAALEYFLYPRPRHKIIQARNQGRGKQSTAFPSQMPVRNDFNSAGIEKKKQR
jgi:hypothetical protein